MQNYHTNTHPNNQPQKQQYSQPNNAYIARIRSNQKPGCQVISDAGNDDSQPFDLGQQWEDQYHSPRGKVQRNSFPSQQNRLKSSNFSKKKEGSEQKTSVRFHKDILVQSDFQTSPSYQNKNQIVQKTTTTQANIILPVHQLTKLLDLLQRGSLQQFCCQFNKHTPINSAIYRKIEYLGHFFKGQSQFYKVMKQIITENNDSNIFYQEQHFYFFQQIPALLNKIGIILASKFDIEFQINASLQNIKENYIYLFKRLSQLSKDIVRKNKQINKHKETQEKYIEKIKKIQANLSQTQEKLNSSHSQQYLSKINSQQLEQLKYTLKTLQHSNHFDKIKIRQLQDNIKLLNSQKQHLILQSISNRPLKTSYIQTNEAQNIIKLEKINGGLVSQIQFLNNVIKSNQLAYRNEIHIKREEINRFMNITKALKQKQLAAYEQKSRTNLSVSTVNQVSHFKYFLQSSDLLSFNEVKMKSQLFNMLTCYSKAKPIQFKLIYKFNKLVPSNFHFYVDNRPNLLLLIRLENGVVIGGFCPGPLQVGGNSSQGFLFSLTLSKMYPLKYKGTSMIYDDYFIIFGNSQLRIHLNQDTLFSNFGISNSNFERQSHNISHFLHGYASNHQTTQFQRNIIMKGYQFYEVKFQN